MTTSPKNVPVSPIDSSDFTYSNSDDVSVTGEVHGIEVYGIGETGSEQDNKKKTAGAGGTVGTIESFSNTGTISLNGEVDSKVAGIALLLQGGNGGNYTNDDSKGNGGAGGSTGDITAINHGTINATGGPFSDGLLLLYGYSSGGDGGNVAYHHGDTNEFNGGNGGAPGSPGNVSITNDGSLQAGSANAPISGPSLYGICAESCGGIAGVGEDGMAGASSEDITISTNVIGDYEIILYWASNNVDDSLSNYLLGVSGSSKGGAGTASYADEVDGGSGGDAGQVYITSLQDITIVGDPGATGQLFYAAAINANSIGGDGGTAFSGSSDNPSTGGKGGDAGTIQVIDSSNLSVEGNNISGIYASSQGGSGGQGNPYSDDNDHSNAGAGGISNLCQVYLGTSNPTTVQTDGDQAYGVRALVQGGDGGSGSKHSQTDGGGAGDGGDGGDTLHVSVYTAMAENTTINTHGSNSPAIYATSQGGVGGDGGELHSNGDHGGLGTGSGAAGNGGSAEDTFVCLSEVDLDGSPGGPGSTVLETFGESSPGIIAQCLGGDGGDAGELEVDIYGDAKDGGAGGNSGNVTVNVYEKASITTHGSESYGILAIAVSGAGGAGGARIGGAGGHSGCGGPSGDTGSNEIILDGSLTTLGDNSPGILAQSITGTGGGGGDTSLVFYAGDGDAGSSGTLGDMTISNSGTIVTSGSASYGILMQSIAGGGGFGGSSQMGSLVSSGGDAAYISNGGVISYDGTSETITTTGDNAAGVLLQSLGGGGGAGGDASGMFAIGGSGGDGGDGGTITVNKAGAGAITTQGQMAIGTLVQSIGGGGGDAGNASSTTIFAALDIGGSGGSGGSGGEIDVSHSGDLTTQGSKSVGVLAQSIGGGGGNGGSAYALTVGPALSTAVSIGGAGGVGGNGDTVNFTHLGGIISTGAFSAPTTPTNLLPVDTIGVLLQSIGGGGGNGGSAFASAVALDVPIPETSVQFSAAVSVALGGDGNHGGDGGAVTAGLDPSSEIMTQGQGAHGVLLQSIGGGGGNGGDSSASSTTIGYGRVAGQLEATTIGITTSVALGGSSTAAGDGGHVTVNLGDDTTSSAPTVVTYGDFSNAVIVQSVGGGGGNAGFGSGTTQDFGNTNTMEATVSLGGAGGSGGGGGKIDVNSVSREATTYGDASHALLLQSIGGGGGISQGGTVSLGASFSYDAEAQGSGGADDGETMTISPSASLELNLGATGGGGGYGHAVSIVHSGAITTYGNDSVGILAQSVGGGGGNVGSAGSEASADNPIDPVLSTLQAVRTFEDVVIDGEIPTPDDELSISASANITLGGLIDGPGGNGTDVELVLNSDSSIIAKGDWSQGVFAQSIGGGGGRAGSAIYRGSAVIMDLHQHVGSSNNITGNGGIMNVTTSGNQISTSGYSAFGLVIQTVGGGGGFAADGSNAASGNIKIGPKGQVAGIGGSIALASSDGLIVDTFGEASHAVFLQSIGGGGGIGGAGSSACEPHYSSIQTTVGAYSGGYGSYESGSVNIYQGVLTLTTANAYSYGVLAQSIGGGGGLASVREPSAAHVGTPNDYGSSTDGQAVELSFASGTTITTGGLGAHGVVAQSIGGGGGIGGYAIGELHVPPVSGSTTRGNGNGDQVTLEIKAGATLTTSGNQAYAIIAQSVGGGGGIVPHSNGVFYGSTNSSGSTGTGGAVSVTVGGDVFVSDSGDGNVGIFAQSTSASRSAHSVTVQIEGNVQVRGSDAIAIWVSDGTNNNSLTNTGLVEAVVALKYTGNHHLTLNNSGSVRGSFMGNVIDSAGAAKISLLNQPSGKYIAGAILQANVINQGLIEIGNKNQDGKVTQTLCAGNFKQCEGAQLVLNADFSAGQSKVLTIAGDAHLRGKVALNIVNPVVGRSIKFLCVEGDITGEFSLEETLMGKALSNFAFTLERIGKEFFIHCKNK